MSGSDFAGYKYVGCYADSGARLLDGAVLTDNTGMTRTDCASYCNGISVGRFYPLIGLEDGNECWCGSSYTRDKGVPNENGCNMPCAGSAAATCGGNGYINVYSATSVPAGITPLPTSAPTMASTFTTTVAKATVTTTSGPKSTITRAPESHGAVIGLAVVTGLLGLALLSLVGLWLLRRRKGQREPVATTEAQLPVFNDQQEMKYGRPVSEMPDDPRSPVYELNNGEDQHLQPVR